MDNAEVVNAGLNNRKEGGSEGGYIYLTWISA